ncbi:MAG: hypothetical protein PW792_16620 [Acidobacteriaceae bacterium]|nr:hypothetical protein [Acidobacteriaceae bacterium]
MSPLSLSIEVHAPIERCFALSTNVELVQGTLGMKQISGPSFVIAESRIVWRGIKFGLPTTHHTLITAFTPPALHTLDGEPTLTAFFQDTQEQGRFAHFHHDHFFRQSSTPGSPTIMEDHVYFDLPFGILGRAASLALLKPHILKLANQRFALLKRLAESTNEWQQYMPA